MKLSVQHCILEGVKNESLTQKVYDFCSKNITPARTSLYHNYSPERLLIEDHLVFSVLFKDACIESISGVFNGGRFPDKTFRVMNRFFHLTRGYASSSRPWNSKLLFDTHTEIVLDCSDFIFISFAEKRSSRTIHSVLKQWDHPNLSWKVGEGLYEVYKHPTDPQLSSWQSIAYAVIRGSDKKPPFSVRPMN